MRQGKVFCALYDYEDLGLPRSKEHWRDCYKSASILVQLNTVPPVAWHSRHLLKPLALAICCFVVMLPRVMLPSGYFWCAVDRIYL